MNTSIIPSVNHFDELAFCLPNEFINLFELVSVIVPFFGNEEYLTLACKGLNQQSITNKEIIIVNDKNSLSNHLPAALKNTSEKVLHNVINQGAYGARNYGLKHATGDFITVHDADDWSHPQKLEMQVKALLDNPQAMASVSHWARCTTDMQFETRPDGSVVHRNVSSLMIRREVFERLGFWDRVSVNADTEYYYRILAAYGPDSIVEVMPGVPLALGRRHENSLTMQPQTHWKTQFGGVRQEYMDAALSWHKECANSGDWYMPYAPQTRPFPVPELIDRAVCELGDRAWPHIKGYQLIAPPTKTVLLCGHAAGRQRFGAERSLLDLAKAIADLGYKLVVTLPERGDGKYIESLRPFCSDIVLLPSPWHEADDVWDIALAAYQQLLAAFAIDLVHINSLVNSAPLYAAEAAGISTILHVRELPEFDVAIQSAMAKDVTDIRETLLSKASLLIANSACTQKYLSGLKKCTVIHNMVSLDRRYPLKHFSAGECIRVGMISSNLPKKGVAEFVQLAELAAESDLPLHFYLVGPNNEHTESLLTDKPNNMSVIDYCGSPDEALVHLDVVISLSRFKESFGRTIAEGMLAGKPVIGYRWGALPELIDNAINGYLVHFGDIKGILMRLNYLTQHPELMFELGQAGQQKACRQFSYAPFKQQLSASYLSLI